MVENYATALAAMGLSNIFVRILKHTYDGVLITLKDSTIVFVNNAYSRIFGVPPEKVLGRKLSKVEPGSIILKVLESGVESINVSEHVATLNERIFGSVLLLPSSENFIGSICIITKYDQKLNDNGGYAPQKYIEFYMDKMLSMRIVLPPAFLKPIGQDREFRQTLFKAYKASKADFPVLVLGESGTGKELIVRAIHENSPRTKHTFVGLNCAAITNTLVESELFGYERGSFTDANKHGKKGMFDHAHKGTLFFDEVCDFELSIQAKILRVLEEKVFRRVGGEKDIPLDTRIISATNKNMETLVLNGEFREDLFYRINTMTIHIPPLRQRGKDLQLLANYFLSVFCNQYQKETKLSDGSLEIFYSYNWPGNVRELRNAMDYAVNMADGPWIAPDDLPPYLNISKAKISLNKRLSHQHREGLLTKQPYSTYKNIMNSFEKELIEAAIKKSPNRTEAMKLLGLSRRAFYLKLNKHDLI